MREINRIVVHHSATKQPNIYKCVTSFNRSHKLRLHPNPNWYWYHIAYHYLIGYDWKIIKTRPLKEVGYHASNLKVNKTSIWICLTWNFDKEIPTDAQYKALIELILELKTWFNITIHWHNEFSNKTCPWTNFNMDYLKKVITFKNKKTVSKKDKLLLNTLMKVNSYIHDKFKDDKLRNYLHKTNEYVKNNYKL